MNPITVILVDDHDVVRTGLRSFLNTQEDVKVVAEARNGEVHNIGIRCHDSSSSKKNGRVCAASLVPQSSVTASLLR